MISMRRDSEGKGTFSAHVLMDGGEVDDGFETFELAGNQSTMSWRARLTSMCLASTQRI